MTITRAVGDDVACPELILTLHRPTATTAVTVTHVPFSSAGSTVPSPVPFDTPDGRVCDSLAKAAVMTRPKLADKSNADHPAPSHISASRTAAHTPAAQAGTHTFPHDLRRRLHARRSLMPGRRWTQATGSLRRVGLVTLPRWHYAKRACATPRGPKAASDTCYAPTPR